MKFSLLLSSTNQNTGLVVSILPFPSSFLSSFLSGHEGVFCLVLVLVVLVVVVAICLFLYDGAADQENGTVTKWRRTSVVSHDDLFYTIGAIHKYRTR